VYVLIGCTDQQAFNRALRAATGLFRLDGYDATLLDSATVIHAPGELWVASISDRLGSMTTLED
jgi:hypothetical protein